MLKRWTESTSKQLAGMIFIVGVTFAFMHPDLGAQVLGTTFLSASALVIGKTSATAYTDKRG